MSGFGPFVHPQACAMMPEIGPEDRSDVELSHCCRGRGGAGLRRLSGAQPLSEAGEYGLCGRRRPHLTLKLAVRRAAEPRSKASVFMPALCRASTPLKHSKDKNVDGRDKPDHDGL